MSLHLYEVAIGAVAGLVLPAAIIGLSGETQERIQHEVQPTVEIAETILDHPLPGEFLAGGLANLPCSQT